MPIDAPDLEIVTHAAIRIAATGRVVIGHLGENHPQLWERAAEEGMLGVNSAGDAWLDGIEDGFVTTSGRFLTREQAMSAALRAGQIGEADRRYIEAHNGGPGLELDSFEQRCQSPRRRRGRCYLNT